MVQFVELMATVSSTVNLTTTPMNLCAPHEPEGAMGMGLLIVLSSVLGILTACYYRYELGLIDVSIEAQEANTATERTPLGPMDSAEEEAKEAKKAAAIQQAIAKAQLLAQQGAAFNPKEAGELAELLNKNFKGEEPELAKMSVEHLMGVISKGANQFLFDEYVYMAVFMVVFGAFSAFQQRALHENADRSVSMP
jgi:hypothetical protein